IYSTYLGGNNSNSGSGIAVDSSSNVYVTGYTSSTDFPTQGPVQAANAGINDAFVLKLNSAGTAFVYSTYLGGSNNDYGYGIAIDSQGNAYVTGYTNSTNFPTRSPLQTANAGSSDAFVAKLDPTGSALVYSTYLGGNDIDYGLSIGVDAGSNAYVTGYTQSTNFPLVNPLQASNPARRDAFVARLVPAGDLAISMANSANPVVTGTTVSYAISVVNNGELTATGVTVTDVVPPGATFVSASTSQGSCGGTSTVIRTLGTLNNGASASLSIVL